MRSYDFHEISPVDFEVLTRDLLQARDKVIFQSFKSGRDHGVDLRYASDCENRVVQCKHMRKSGYRALLREVRAEVEKIKRMRPAPSRYYLSTSVELSNHTAAEITGLYTSAPYAEERTPDAKVLDRWTLPLRPVSAPPA